MRQAKKLPIKKLNTYKPQQIMRMTDSYNSNNVKSGPPLAGPVQQMQHHTLYTQQPSNHDQFYEQVNEPHYYQSNPQVQQYMPQHQQEVSLAVAKPGYEGMK